uniref:hypothetical protein n=1 Tax=Polynucleobacter sp. TaxID=2029855 RepID=UPI004048C3BE
MSKGLILCGVTDQNYSEYKFIAVTSLCLRLALEKQGIETEDLWGLSVEIDSVKVLKCIDDGLHQEAAFSSEMRWAPLALVRIIRRYLHYAQYKCRLQSWIVDKSINEIVLSSGDDSDLVAAATDVAKEFSLKISILEGGFDVYSGLDPFLYNESLPNYQSIDPPFITYILAKIVKYFNILTMYEPYTNLPISNRGHTTFKWWKTIAFFETLIDKTLLLIKKKQSQIKINPLKLTIGAYQKKDFILKKHLWKSFDENELRVINSGLSEFFKTHNLKKIDRIVDALKLFFSTSGIKRLIIMDSQITHCRLLAFSARSSGVFVDYLPHGIVIEDQTTSTQTIFSPHRVLAWNEAAQKRYESYGISSMAISHPRNLINSFKTTLVKTPSLSIKKCLVLFSCNDSISLDAMERDCLDISQGLKALNVSPYWKLHNTGPLLYEIRVSIIKRLENILNTSIDLLDTSLDTADIFKDYDFIIIGRLTSAIYEAAQSRIPFIVYKGHIERMGAFDGINIPYASSIIDLKRGIEEFDLYNFFDTCQKINNSLMCNKSPFNLR